MLVFRTLLFSSCLLLAALTGCDDKEPKSSSFSVGTDGEYPVPGLGFDGEVMVSVRHVGYGSRMDPEDRMDEPSIGNLRVVDDDSTLAEDNLMFEGETLRFNYDDTTYELLVESFDLDDDNPRDSRATLVVERL